MKHEKTRNLFVKRFLDLQKLLLILISMEPDHTTKPRTMKRHCNKTPRSGAWTRQGCNPLQKLLLIGDENWRIINERY